MAKKDKKKNRAVQSQGRAVNPPNIVNEVGLDTPLTMRGENVLAFYQDWYETLPTPVDDIDEQLGEELKERMMLDPIISSNIHYQVDAALDRPIEILPLIQDKASEFYEPSLKAYDFANYALEGYREKMPDALRAMGDAMFVRGHSIAEKSTALIDTPVGYIRSIDWLAPRGGESALFVVDPYGREQGIACKVPPLVDSRGRTLESRGISDNEKPHISGLPTGWDVYNRNRFAVLSNRGKNNDPRGSSVLRSIYNEYYLIQAIFPHYLKFLLKFASPSLVGKLGEESSRPVRGGGDPLSSLYNDMGRFENSSRIALPAGAELELLFSQGEGQAFLAAFGLLEQRIVRGITNQMLNNTAARNNIRAAAVTHQDIQNVLVRVVRRLMATMLRQDVLAWLTLVNLGPEYVRFTPTTSLATVAPEDQAAMLDAVSGAWNRGYLHTSQLRGMDAMMGLPYREDTAPGFYPSSAQEEPTDPQAQLEAQQKAAQDKKESSPSKTKPKED